MKFKKETVKDKLDKIKKLIKNKGLAAHEISEELNINRDSLRKYLGFMRKNKEIYICDYELSGCAYAPVYKTGNEKDCEKVTDKIKVVKVKQLTFHKIKYDFMTAWIPRRNLKNEAYINE